MIVLLLSIKHQKTWSQLVLLDEVESLSNLVAWKPEMTMCLRAGDSALHDVLCRTTISLLAPELKTDGSGSGSVISNPSIASGGSC